jgi:hypothetical protein
VWLENLIVRLLNLRRTGPVTGPSEGLLLGYDAEGGAPVRMSKQRRMEHMVVVGKTGVGKSHFLQQLALAHMHRGEGFVFFDYHGDAIQSLLALAANVPGAAERVVVVDPTHPTASPGLNPLEIPAAESDQIFGHTSELASILRNRWSVDAFGPRTEEVLRNTLYTLACHGLTLVEAPHLLTSAPWRQQLTSRLPSAEVRNYWHDRFEPLSEAMKASFREPLLNKITGFLTEPAVRHLLGSARSTVRFHEHMERGDWVFVNLNKGRLREHAQTLGNLIFAKLQFEVLARSGIPPSRRRLFTIICDEVQNLADNDLATLLTEGRKYACCVITANQFWEQAPRPLRAALLAAGSQTFFRLSAADARALAPELTVHAAQKYVNLLTELARGEAVVRIGGQAPHVIKVPAFPKDSAAGTAAARRLYSLSVARFTRPRAAIEDDIAQRRAPSPQRHAEPPITNHATDQQGQTEW